MEFWLTYNNNNERFQLPVNPSEISISNGSQNTTVSVSGLGEVNIIQESTLKAFSFGSFFPKEYGPYCEHVAGLPDPWEAIQTIERWKNSGYPARFVVTGTNINYPVSIESFEYNEQGGDVGTVNYTLSLKEFRFVKPRKLEEVKKDSGTVLVKNNKTERPNTSQKTPKTYTVKKGDTIWKIAKAQLKNGSKYKDIVKLNNLKSPYALEVGQVLKLS